MARGSYQIALDYARRTGQAGRIVPSGGGNAGSVTYRFVPSSGIGKGSNLAQAQAQSQSQSLVDQYKQMASEAKAANVAREKEIRSIYANILNSISGSNASMRASGLSDIETQSKQLVGQESQNLISSGLYGTTTAASIPTRVESSFARPARLKLEDLLASRKREAQLGLAGFVERIENPYPDYNALIQAQISANS